MKSLSLEPHVSSHRWQRSPRQGVVRSAPPRPSGWWLLWHKVLRDRSAVLGLS